MSTLSQFIDAAVTASQMERESIHEKNMLLVMTALNKTQEIARINNFVHVETLANFYLAFFVFQQAGEVHETNGIKGMHHFLNNEVNDNLDTNKCCWCRKQCEGMLKCEGCMVMRFCCKKHQKMSWCLPFSSVLIPHKQICDLLSLCKVFTRLVSQHGSEHATTIASITYNRAIKDFLQVGLFKDYVLKTLASIQHQHMITFFDISSPLSTPMIRL